MVAFTPAKTILVTATTSSAPTALSSDFGLQVQFYNGGSVTVYVAFGTTAALAVATVPTSTAAGKCHPVPPGAILIYSRAVGEDFVGAITPSSTAVFTASAGVGE